MNDSSVALNIKENTETKVNEAKGVVEWKDIDNELFYFAHPYTRLNKWAQEANFKLCCVRTAKLISLGFWVYSPVVHTHPIHFVWPDFLDFDNDEWGRWMQLNRIIIKRTNFTGLILAPGWKKSRGCQEEKDYFEQLQKPIFLYDDIVNAERNNAKKKTT